jgi:lipopolysaccharide transport system permease protein
VLQPLAMIVVYTVVFATVMRARLAGVDRTFAYSIYLCSGVLTWELFAEITRRGQTVFIDNANLLKKLSFPRITLPVNMIAGSLVNFAIVFSLFLIFLAVSGNFPGLVFIAFVPVIAVLVLFALGLGIALGILNVFFRDVGQFFTIALQFWFWLTPVVYPATILPARLQGWLRLNPMTPIIAAMQQIFVYGNWPDWLSLVPVLVVSLLLCAWGWRLFRRHSGELVDEL